MCSASGGCLLYDGEEALLCERRTIGTVAIDEKGSYHDRLLLSLPVKEPRLWSAEIPNLYRLVVAPGNRVDNWLKLRPTTSVFAVLRSKWSIAGQWQGVLIRGATHNDSIS